MNWPSFFAHRTLHMRRSAVRKLLKVIAQPGMISFAGGIPAPELFPLDEIARATTAVWQRNGRDALQYGETEGVPALRDWIANRFSRPGLNVQRQNVMIVSGSQQALDLIGKVFLDPGDRVLCENPTYLAMLSAWRPHLPDFVPVPSDEEGMRVDAVPRGLARGAKLIYLVPNFQNPQGTTLSLARRRRLLESATGRAVVVEDNPYGDLRYEGEALPHVLDLDADRGGHDELDTCVIHLGTFSKVLAPGLRVGWVIAASDVIDKLVQAKQAADLHTSTLCQYVVLELVRDGLLERHLPVLRKAYKVRRDAMLAALAKHCPPEIHWTRPEGGMFLLVTLPPIVRAGALLKETLAEGVAFVPGDDFHLDDTGRNTLRLNFSNATPERIEEGVKRFANVLGGFLRRRAL